MRRRRRRVEPASCDSAGYQRGRGVAVHAGRADTNRIHGGGHERRTASTVALLVFQSKGFVRLVGGSITINRPVPSVVSRSTESPSECGRRSAPPSAQQRPGAEASVPQHSCSLDRAACGPLRAHPKTRPTRDRQLRRAKRPRERARRRARSKAPPPAILSANCSPSTPSSSTPARAPRAPLARAHRRSRAYRPSLVRRQWRRFELYLIVLSVRRRIHCGIGRFCFCFLARMRLVRKVLCDGYGSHTGSISASTVKSTHYSYRRGVCISPQGPVHSAERAENRARTYHFGWKFVTCGAIAAVGKPPHASGSPHQPANFSPETLGLRWTTPQLSARNYALVKPGPLGQIIMYKTLIYPSQLGKLNPPGKISKPEE